jgi:hypothetical protein
MVAIDLFGLILASAVKVTLFLELVTVTVTCSKNELVTGESYQ